MEKWSSRTEDADLPYRPGACSFAGKIRAFSLLTGLENLIILAAGLCVLLQHRRVKGRDAGKERGWERVRLAQSGGTESTQSAQALQEAVRAGPCSKHGRFFMGSCVCACWACCAAAALIYPCTEEISQLSAAQGADIPPFSPVSELSHRAGAGSQPPFAFLHAVRRCQRVVWDQVRSPGSSLRGQSPSCWQGNPAGRSAPSWLPFCVRTPAGSALLVSLPIPWGIFVPQGEGAGRQVTSARHLQGFEARPPEPNWRHDPLLWARWMSSEPHRNPFPWSSVFLCLENPAVLTQSCTTSPTGRSPACR